MRYLIILFVFFTACNDQQYSVQQPSTDSSITISPTHATDTIHSNNSWVDKLNGKKYSIPDSIAGKPVSFYLDNPKVAIIAKSFYKGHFRPIDNDSTATLLSYATIEDSTIRPFYRWCLDLTITISDGALAEYPGGPALAYATRFPGEFFDYMDKDLLRQRYKQWVEIIAYSGIADYNKEESLIQKEITSKMNTNCHSCDDNTKSRIITFAKDITTAIKLQD